MADGECAGHDVAGTGDPFCEGGCENVAVGEDVDVEGAGCGVVQDEWCVGEGAGGGEA